MAITYPVDVANTRWTVYQASTQSIIDRNVIWPVADGSEIPGLNEDYIYLLEQVDAKPDVDQRVYVLIRQENLDVEANLNHITWTPQKRSNEELKIAAENKETEELSMHVKLEREVIETRLALTALLNFIDGVQFPPKVRTMVNKYKAKGVKIWNNRDRVNFLITQIENGDDIDLETGWETIDE